MLELIAALRHAAETVRSQIPKGELTRASVELLLERAEAVCTAAAAAGNADGTATVAAPPATNSVPTASAASSSGETPRRTRSKRQEARERWAKIARQNEEEEGRRPDPASR